MQDVGAGERPGGCIILPPVSHRVSRRSMPLENNLGRLCSGVGPSICVVLNREGNDGDDVSAIVAWKYRTGGGGDICGIAINPTLVASAFAGKIPI